MPGLFHSIQIWMERMKFCTNIYIQQIQIWHSAVMVWTVNCQCLVICGWKQLMYSLNPWREIKFCNRQNCAPWPQMNACTHWTLWTPINISIFHWQEEGKEIVKNLWTCEAQYLYSSVCQTLMGKFDKFLIFDFLSYKHLNLLDTCNLKVDKGNWRIEWDHILLRLSFISPAAF